MIFTQAIGGAREAFESVVRGHRERCDSHQSAQP
jgi:hypothetical protein